MHFNKAVWINTLTSKHGKSSKSTRIPRIAFNGISSSRTIGKFVNASEKTKPEYNEINQLQQQYIYMKQFSLLIVELSLKKKKKSMV